MVGKQVTPDPDAPEAHQSSTNVSNIKIKNYIHIDNKVVVQEWSAPFTYNSKMPNTSKAGDDKERNAASPDNRYISESSPVVAKKREPE